MTINCIFPLAFCLPPPPCVSTSTPTVPDRFNLQHSGRSWSGKMSDSNEVVTDLRLEKRARRRFSAAEKKRLLAEADGLGHGEKGAWLRLMGLYAGQLSNWRKDLVEHREAGLAARNPGRKAADSSENEIERLKKANGRLEKRAYVAEQLVDLQKKFCTCSRPTTASRRREHLAVTACQLVQVRGLPR